MAKTTTALGPLSKLLDGDTGQLLGIIDAEGRPFTPLPVLDFTAAQLSAMAAAGGLTPYATYIASDDPDATPQYAKDAYTLATFGGGGMRVDSTSGYLVDDLGGVFAVIEQTPILTTLTASGVGKNAPTEFSGLDVTAINGQTTATIYDNASAASGNILAVFVLSTVGHYPVDSAWTRPVGGKGVVSAVNGVYVSFSGGTSRTVNVLG